MNIEGRLTINLAMVQDRVSAVEINSSRPVHASRVFVGKQLAEVQKMLPLLFSLCGTAQACASARACEQALRASVSPYVQQLRVSLVNMETLREHLWRTLLDWPAFIDGDSTPDRAGLAGMVQLQRDYQQALCGSSEPFLLHARVGEPDVDELEAVLQRLSSLLQKTVFGMAPMDWVTRLTDWQELQDWAAERHSIAAILIDQLMHSGWHGVGACESAHLPVLDESSLHQAMQDEQYLEQPLWQGKCCETSCFSRVDSPLLSSLVFSSGNGLLSRLVARLTEIALLSGRLLPDAGVADAAQSFRGVVNPAIGQVAAARGQLVHRVELDGEQVRNYQILAPTEWNFHPKGVVAQSLLMLKGPPQQVERQARMLINAIDPCVGYELKLLQRFYNA